MQYLLGMMFQPSLFGVLNVASIAAFFRRMDRVAVWLAAASVYMHFSYFLSAISLMVGYAVVLTIRVSKCAAERGAACSPTRIVLLGALALLPILLFVAFRFWPTTPEIAERA